MINKKIDNKPEENTDVGADPTFLAKNRYETLYQVVFPGVAMVESRNGTDSTMRKVDQVMLENTA